MPTQAYKLLDGKPVFGVTTIIGDGLGWGQEPLMHWAAKCAREGKSFIEERDWAARVGTITHARFEAYLGGPICDLAQYAPAEVTESDAPFKALREWRESVNLRIHHLELPLVSEAFEFGGTLDIDGDMSGEDVIVDVKTSSQLRPANIIQLAAYREAWREKIGRHSGKGPKCILLHAPRGCKKAKPITIKPEALDYGWKAFLSLLKLHQIKPHLALKLAASEASA